MENSNTKSAAMERAGEVASPTAGSVDTPEFGELMDAYYCARKDAFDEFTWEKRNEYAAAHRALTAHITALIEAARQEERDRAKFRLNVHEQRIQELEAQFATRTPVQAGVVERAARAMAEHVGWHQWDTATDFTHTHAGNDPEDERDYWRGLALVALSNATPVQAVGGDALPVQSEFEKQAAFQGVRNFTLATDMQCSNGWFPATYACPETELAWRVWANKSAALNKGGSDE